MAILLALWAASVAAQDVDIDALKFSASQGQRYDSNLFRRSTNARSETLSTTTVGLQLDKRYSLQRVELDVNLASNRYRSNDYLNFNAVNYRAVWHWSVTPRLRGSISRTRSDDINTFDYFRSFDRNVRTDIKTGATAVAVLGRDWLLLGGIERDERSNERPTAQSGDYTLRNISAGVRRVFPSGSRISYRVLDGQGDYFNRVPGVTATPTAYSQLEHEVQVSWSVTAKTTVSATLGYIDRKHRDLAVRDFSGLRGNLNVNWRATGKSGVQLTLARSISPYQTNTASYTVGNRISMYPYWSISSRAAVYASLDHLRYSFDGALPGVDNNAREDRTNIAGLGVRWEPFDALSLNAGVYRELRTSNLEGFGYSNTSAQFSAKFVF
ncbi:XrtB/PEP-CTERM-associated polysaccharide biosynthesis outer membrane protein EpsL [Pseudorhodoferax soli]|uniref:XrtB/PEP-CTERM-associated polysaccharide biosynthesis outer membrane protein EpsL n=1 Tax=Pseudorhodoferax soli TaxID=545864 RepID=UPI0014760840|nr:XrtB/PEP-CTERM-associated polysaccharide biosynthesis outer membrane protein EpsL [Pseudorhodoferax soli]